MLICAGKTHEVHQRSSGNCPVRDGARLCATTVAGIHRGRRLALYGDARLGAGTRRNSHWRNHGHESHRARRTSSRTGRRASQAHRHAVPEKYFGEPVHTPDRSEDPVYRRPRRIDQFGHRQDGVDDQGPTVQPGRRTRARQDTSQPLEVEFPADALKATKLREIRLEVTYIASPLMEHVLNFPVSISQ